MSVPSHNISVKKYSYHTLLFTVTLWSTTLLHEFNKPVTAIKTTISQGYHSSKQSWSGIFGHNKPNPD